MLRFLAPMLGGEAGRRTLPLRVLVPLAVLTVAGFLFDQYIHGRFR